MIGNQVILICLNIFYSLEKKTLTSELFLDQGRKPSAIAFSSSCDTKTTDTKAHEILLRV